LIPVLFVLQPKPLRSVPLGLYEFLKAGNLAVERRERAAFPANLASTTYLTLVLLYQVPDAERDPQLSALLGTLRRR